MVVGGRQEKVSYFGEQANYFQAGPVKEGGEEGSGVAGFIYVLSGLMD